MNKLSPKAGASDMKFASTMRGEERQGSKHSFRRGRKGHGADFAPTKEADKWQRDSTAAVWAAWGAGT